MEIKRNIHLNRIIARKGNGMIKVITGMRRCGKSYLLFTLFHNYLLEQGVDEQHIIKVDMEDRRNAALRNPDALLNYIDSRMTDSQQYYILLDEVQLVAEFEDVLNSYLKITNADVYVTGSNAKFLSKDVITEFRGRGDEIRITPLSFQEFMSAKEGNREDLLNEYLTYGGLPQVVTMDEIERKVEYLKNLFTHTYIRDIKERYEIKKDDDLEELINLVASNIGSLTNPTKLENCFKSVKQSCLSKDTIKNYIDLMQDAFIIEKSIRFDIKGKKYIDTPSKYYFTDLGLRNARLNFRQTEFTHLLENAIYNELRLRGYSVDVGQIPIFTIREDGKRQRSTLEVDFVCNLGYKRCYIQSAYALPTEDKMKQEFNSLLRIKDSFKKIVIVGTPTPTYQNEEGILTINIYDFLMNPESLNI
ncbi:ATP-binding protein [Segatella hominis]|uniref:ATP-binding protein n=1 Tax=Segatella hominis TaxID=2518605 RepID=UPI001C4928EC|nr:ATP-binding protein [Segatella hominis]WOZ80551.1 ATP-binding protein [Segatella hominis]